MAFGNFGSATTSAPAFGSTTSFGFGNTTSQAGSTGFSFGGTTTAPAATGFSFGAQSTAAPFSFTNTATTSAPSFGFGAPSAFGATTTSANTGFNFGQPTGGLGGGGLFSNTGGLNAATQQPAAGAGQDAVTNLVNSITFPMLYGDERDGILAKWNQLQASWGTGKGYFTQNAQPVEFTPENPFCCFKAVGYSCLPAAKPEDCLVGVVINRKEAEIVAQQQQVSETLHKCFGSKPTLSVTIEGVKALSDDRTEVVFYVLERLQTGLTRRIPPQEVCTFMEQPTLKAQLAQVGILNATPKVAPSKEQLQHYLDNPPAGVEPIVWRQAKLDNPNPDKLLPVPMVGFQALHSRIKCQEYETKQHHERLNIISDDITDLRRSHTSTASALSEQKRRLLDLQHRVLRVLVSQEIARKTGYALQADEEQLRTKLEALQAQLSAPTQFKGHLKELTSQIRMQNFQTSSYEGERYSMDQVAREEIKEQLLAQQEGITLLMNIIKEDAADLKTIAEFIDDEAARRR